MSAKALRSQGWTPSPPARIQALAAAVIESAKEVISSRYPLVVVVENDIGKVLGNALNVLLKREKDVICIDGIRTLSGDYIDIGKSDWIKGFDGQSLERPDAWRVRKDGGQFDYMAGATITPRAVVAAVARTLAFFHDYRAELAGSTR